MLGEVGRSVAAYAGAGVYLDIALGWVAGRSTTAPVELRDEGEDRASGYSLRTPGLALLADGAHRRHPRAAPGQRARAGVRAVRLLLAIFIAYRQLVHPAPTEGWTSLIVVILISTGAILFSLGVIAEYVGVAVNMAMGKPLYLITQDPAEGPLGRRRP